MPVSVPQILKTIAFTLGANDYSLDVLDVAVVPTPGATQSVLTLDGIPHTDVATETWSLDIRCIIDWDTVRPGLASYLMTNKGNSVAFSFRNTTAAASIRDVAGALYLSADVTASAMIDL